MTPPPRPLVRVVVVNHNGGDLTMRCVESLMATEWPADRLEVVVVDNGSTDGIADRMRAHAPATRVVQAGFNRGFAGGVNLGLDDLAGVDHVALLNNDATVEPTWLEPLAEALAGDSSVGAASPKILLEGCFVDVEISCQSRRAGVGDRRRLGVRLSGARVGDRDVWGRAQPVHGFWEEEHGSGLEPRFRWTGDRATLRLPVGDGSEGPERPDRAGDTRPTAWLRLAADGETTVALTSGPDQTAVAVGDEPEWFEVPLGGAPTDVINNVGCVLERGGYGADRGFLERDEGQYERVEEVFAWCGAAVLLSRPYIESVGLFDERFFLYYEDFDLSWRGRSQGWRYMYVPASRVRHVHSASSVEGSRLFDHYVERNRLLALARNAPAGLAAGAALHHLLVTASYARRDVVSPALHRRRPSVETVRRRLGSFGSYAALLPPTLVERRRLQKRSTVARDQVLRWMVPATSPFDSRDVSH